MLKAKVRAYDEAARHDKTGQEFEEPTGAALRDEASGDYFACAPSYALWYALRVYCPALAVRYPIAR
jgi:hypothetical protein